ncbi:helix-turn-helix domain-containing protein [Actinoplanes sp. NBRC 103695]|uniref:PucR family transcriptional regulator n=1 Tax=Actinoplanes sp. NBRC 103695 TaxID=3032202 RepID=UPI0024A1D488|nr:helix-turn-helix domain-containing protein [Actinoplanes sp. NBRC 103695]GLY93908.1 Fis family transcriptional regulator [Actinoplanes sp. NBRC 103695]
MTRPLQVDGQAAKNGRARPGEMFPRHMAVIMRAELPSLAADIIAEIRETIPEYARPMDGPYGQTMRLGVEHALESFVDQVADPSASHQGWDWVFRRLGRYEANEDRSLDSLQAAYRVGARVAWQRAVKVGRREGLASSIMFQLADALFGYIDQLATLSVEGYMEAKARSADALIQWRRRLLRLILESPPAPESAVKDLANLAGWTVPDEVTMIAVGLGTQDVTPPLDDVLSDLDTIEPYLLVPGRLSADRRTGLIEEFPGSRLAVGPTVRLSAAPDSLRWARQALALGESGAIDPEPAILCEDHLCEMLLFSDWPLVEQLADREFAAVRDLTAHRRDRLIETLEAWLEARGSAAKIAERLRVHPQTVRYRMRQLEQSLGEQLDDPDSRFAMELVLRARRLHERTTRGGVR